MGSDSSQTFRQLLPLYLACYALWLGLCAMGGWLILAARSAIFDVSLALRFNPWQVHAVVQLSTVTFGLIWLVGILLLEHYLRQGVIKNQLWARAARVFLFEVVVLGICYGLQALLP